MEIRTHFVGQSEVLPANSQGKKQGVIGEDNILIPCNEPQIMQQSQKIIIQQITVSRISDDNLHISTNKSLHKEHKATGTLNSLLNTFILIQLYINLTKMMRAKTLIILTLMTLVLLSFCQGGCSDFYMSDFGYYGKCTSTSTSDRPINATAILKVYNGKTVPWYGTKDWVSFLVRANNTILSLYKQPNCFPAQPQQQAMKAGTNYQLSIICTMLTIPLKKGDKILVQTWVDERHPTYGHLGFFISIPNLSTDNDIKRMDEKTKAFIRKQARQLIMNDRLSLLAE